MLDRSLCNRTTFSYLVKFPTFHNCCYHEQRGRSSSSASATAETSNLHTKTAPHLIYNYHLGKYLATAKAFGSFLPTCRSRLCSFHELLNRYPPRHCITRSIILWQDGKPPSQRNPLMLTCGFVGLKSLSGYTTMPPSPPKILRERDWTEGIS